MDPVKLQILEDAWLKDAQAMEASAERMEDRPVKGFRHPFRHAYDMELEPERLKEVAGYVRHCVGGFRGWCSEFLERVRAMAEA